MKNEFESWLEQQKQQGLKDFKFVIGGDTSNASVAKAKEEVLHISKLAEAGFVEPFPLARDYSAELTDLHNQL